MEPTAEQSLLSRQAVGCRKLGPGALCSALRASKAGTAHGPHPAQPGWRQSRPAVPRQSWSCPAHPARVQAQALHFPQCPENETPSELPHSGKAASAAAPPSSPVGSQPGAAHTETDAVWDTRSTSYLQRQKEGSTPGTRPASQEYVSEKEMLSVQAVSSL